MDFSVFRRLPGRGSHGVPDGVRPGYSGRQRLRPVEMAKYAPKLLGCRGGPGVRQHSRPVLIQVSPSCMSRFKQSPWILHYDASSCNGCDIETLACLTPVYDVERLGVVNTGNPKHADIFLVTGAVNEQSRQVIRNIYHQLPEPKVVVAVGICACTGGIFRECYNVSGGVDTAIPVDAYIPGCAARPEAIIDGVL